MNSAPEPTGLTRRVTNKITSAADRVLTQAAILDSCSDDEILELMVKVRERAADGELDPKVISPDCETVTAATIVMADRVFGLRMHPNQVVTALAMVTGTIAELATGEGKTLASAATVAWWALFGKGVHVATANDYLAWRDGRHMAHLFNALGLTVGVTSTQVSPEARAAAYRKDITYGTFAQFGFDYLSDNINVSPYTIQRGDFFAILLDEADNILIDEARNPLIITGPDPRSSELWLNYAKLAARIPRELVDIDEADEAISLTDEGVDYVEDLLGERLYVDPVALHHLDAALKARFLFEKDRDYIIHEDEDGVRSIAVVDETTGRLMRNRRYLDSLHESLEAKEGIPVRAGNQTLASVTIQSYFGSYEVMAGMTGTASQDAHELEVTYGTPVVSVPSHVPSNRIDLDDELFLTRQEKMAAVVEEIRTAQMEGQPVLVGCPSVKESEELSQLLVLADVPHDLLNARRPFDEAAIIAQAGRAGAVTVTTAMAGRGVDIKLGGSPEGLAAAEMGLAITGQGGAEEAVNILTSSGDLERVAAYQSALAKWTEVCEAEREKVIALGGLLIVATSRHLSRRADDQLRGRAGRQGEPGMSQFYLSAEDELIRIFAGKQAEKMLLLSKRSGGAPSRKMLAKLIESAQARIGAEHAKLRSDLAEDDKVMASQRKAIYAWRRRTLNSDADDLLDRWFTNAYRTVLEPALAGRSMTDIPQEDILEVLKDVAPFEPDEEFWQAGGLDGAVTTLAEQATERRMADWSNAPIEDVNALVPRIFVHHIDKTWRDLLVEIEEIRSAIHWRSLGGRSITVEFAMECSRAFTHAVQDCEVQVAQGIWSAYFKDPDPNAT